MRKRDLIVKIRKEFPELQWKRATHVVEGWDHYVINLDNKWIFRFPRMAEYRKILVDEIPLLKYLSPRLNIRIPVYKFVSKDKTFAGYELIKGIQLSKEIFAKLPQKTKSVIARQIADFLTRLHRTPIAQAKKLKVPKRNKLAEYQELKRSMERLVYYRIPKAHKVLIEDFLLELKLCLKFPNWVLIHNDLFPAHILLDENKKRINGIIDFADREIDDPALDFAELWVYGRDFVTAVYKLYRGPKDSEFINRSILYYKRMPLYVMNATPKTEGTTAFTKGYKLFKEIWLNV